MRDVMDLAGYTAQLYSVPPEEFVPARADAAAQARDDGDPATAAVLAGLRKPTVAAWLVNSLVRHRQAEIDALLDLGESMRAAQDALAGDQLRELSRQRRAAIRVLTREIHSLAADHGHSVSAAAEREVEQTLLAAVTDSGATEAVRTGALTRTLQTNGVDPVDTSGAVASDVPAPAPRRRARRSAADAERAREQAEARAEALARAQAELDAAKSDRDAARRRERDAVRVLEKATDAAGQARRIVEDLTSRLAAATEESDHAARAQASAQEDRDQAHDGSERADAAYEQAAFRLRERSAD